MRDLKTLPRRNRREGKRRSEALLVSQINSQTIPVRTEELTAEEIIKARKDGLSRLCLKMRTPMLMMMIFKAFLSF